MKKFNMMVTFMVLPVYWLRSQYLRRFSTQEKINQELKLYPKHYLGFRRIKVVKHGNQPSPDQACIYISNHQSMNDIFITIAAVNRPFRFIAKKELFTSFISGTFMKMSASYPLDRDDARQSLQILKEAVTDVKAGYSVLAFPEGTRSHRKEMLPFKDGIFAMLKKAKAPIVPLYIKESFNEKQKAFHVYFAESLNPSDYENLKGSELSEKVFMIMEDLMSKAYES